MRCRARNDANQPGGGRFGVYHQKRGLGLAASFDGADQVRPRRQSEHDKAIFAVKLGKFCSDRPGTAVEVPRMCPHPVLVGMDQGISSIVSTLNPRAVGYCLGWSAALSRASLHHRRQPLSDTSVLNSAREPT